MGAGAERGDRNIESATLCFWVNVEWASAGNLTEGVLLLEELQKFSYEDALTGLKNRRYFDQLFEHESAVAQRNDLPLSLLIVDIDHFKRFNDTHGHEAGDNALKIVAGILQNQFRESDIVCRYGGEEFVVVMPGATSEAARDKANQLCEAVAASDSGRQGALSRQVSRS